jgi:hypothetical protein
MTEETNTHLQKRLELEHALAHPFIQYFGLDSSASNIDLDIHNYIESENGYCGDELNEILLLVGTRALELYRFNKHE